MLTDVQTQQYIIHHYYCTFRGSKNVQRESKPIKTISNLFWLRFVHLSHSQIKRTLFQAPAAPDLTPTRQQHLHFAVRRRGWLPSALLHCLGLVRGGMRGGGGVAVLSIVCKFLPVFCCCATRNVHVGISERCQQTTLIFRHSHTHARRVRYHAAQLCSTRHSGTVPQPRIHKPHSNTN